MAVAEGAVEVEVVADLEAVEEEGVVEAVAAALPANQVS